MRLGNRWDMVFHQSLKRDVKGEIAEFDIDPRLMEEFATQVSAAIRKRLEDQAMIVVCSTPEELGRFHKAELDKWGPVIKEAGLTQQN